MKFKELNKRFILAFEDDEMEEINTVGVKFIREDDSLPDAEAIVHDRMTWCQAVKLAGAGKIVLIDEKNIGCPAGGITLGLVEQYRETPLEGERIYTDGMKKPAPPADFSKGIVYACKDSGHMEYALFGDYDAGRYKTLEASLDAISGMTVIQPKCMKAVVAFPPEADIQPDVVILPMTPRQALRTTQAYGFEKGERTKIDFIGIRAVCSEMTAIPFVEQRLNGSPFCLGARVIAKWQGTKMAYGMPLSIFETIVARMEDSREGFPFSLYPK